MMTTTSDFILRNARIVLADRVIEHGWLAVADGRIAEIGETGVPAGGHDMGGDLLMPGLIELHTDHLEAHYMPRPKVQWNPVAAVVSYDGQLATCGITTVLDSLRNVVRDPRVALMLLIPGSLNALRINGRALISADAALLESFKVDGKAPRSVMVMTVEEIYFQCGRALIRSELWNPDKHIDPATLPTPGQILASMTEGRVGGDAYDRAWPQRAAETMW